MSEGFGPGLCPVSAQSRKEEVVNTISHGLGFVLSICAFLVLLWHARSSRHTWALLCVWIYGVSLVLVYAASTFYHLVKSIKWKRRMQVVDHICIFLLIAGTYTPFALLVLPAPLGRRLCLAVWCVAALGITLKLIFGGRYEPLFVAFYIAMGSMALIAVEPLQQLLPMVTFGCLVAGGVLYKVGVVFFMWQRLPFNHGIWHLFVMGGSLLHFLSIYDVLSLRRFWAFLM